MSGKVCEFNLCGAPAVSLYRLDCPYCDQLMIRAYCADHDAEIQRRINTDRAVRCTKCDKGKRSKETYKRLGAA